MTKVWISVLLVLAMAAAAGADDLYEATVTGERDAAVLQASGVEPLVALGNTYLLMADSEAVDVISSAGVTLIRVASGVTLDNLAIDRRFDDENLSKYELVYERDAVRILRARRSELALGTAGGDLWPVEPSGVDFTYTEPGRRVQTMLDYPLDLDSLIAQVSQDSLTAYVEQLQAFGVRLTGTIASHNARDWIASKFLSYGYDSVYTDPFPGDQLGSSSSVTSYNVVAVKEGTANPDQYIVIGGHYDAVPGSPGADDNGSGTAATMELARILANVESDKTLVYIAFDSEESGLIGSKWYADAAAARGDDIVFVMNFDMIGYYENTVEADLHYGPQTAYAELWAQLADSLLGVTGYLSGQSTRSDHYPFQVRGYDVCFLIERVWSTVYHQPQDSTTYMDFEYMTKLVKASLATVYAVDVAVAPVAVNSVVDVGDGMSLQVGWGQAGASAIDHYVVCYDTEPPSGMDSVVVSGGTYETIISGLSVGQEYGVWVVPHDVNGRTPYAYNKSFGIPYFYPALPVNVTALPLYEAIELQWSCRNTELDFDHYAVVRDGLLLPDVIADSSFVDDDPGLGADMHSYQVVAVDADGNLSDTTGRDPVAMRAATLQTGRVLAVNRSSTLVSSIVNESATSEVMIEALDGYDFDYYSDTAYGVFYARGIQLTDMVGYELVVMGGESMRADDFGMLPDHGGILDKITYYMDLGGKVILFGRWGNIVTSPEPPAVVDFLPDSCTAGYLTHFGTSGRVEPYSLLVGTSLVSDFIGAHSQAAGYPDLVWDPSACNLHSAPFSVTEGIPAASFAVLSGSPVDLLYTYDSSTDSVLSEGQPLAWRSVGGAHDYVFFHLPLSFMQRTAAVTALRQAVLDLDIGTAADLDGDGVANASDNCPDVYNPGQADADLNGIGDACCCGYHTGGYTGNVDCDMDGKRSLVDIARLVDYVYLSKRPLCCEYNGNTNGDAEAKINLADIERLIDQVYISRAETSVCE